jgi:hypothetical protein
MYRAACTAKCYRGVPALPRNCCLGHCNRADRLRITLSWPCLRRVQIKMICMHNNLSTRGPLVVLLVLGGSVGLRIFNSSHPSGGRGVTPLPPSATSLLPWVAFPALSFYASWVEVCNMRIINSQLNNLLFESMIAITGMPFTLMLRHICRLHACALLVSMTDFCFRAYVASFEQQSSCRT